MTRPEMSSMERTLAALNHQEADRDSGELRRATPREPGEAQQ